ncbi:CHAT domain-containing protein [Stigmatella sp. ncwal1]|uniref:CHAT domain-containing protein n=1 Tax=Stigmatella ashevillensis TaxID=2995309 RepID=A0ABT5DLG3_9BACT|nr:CHAT domain-containing protein [Stigmatella ashevillena]MDC0713975.1 CHAT domain-containing protein [Stigmatella ashevillena]
MTPSCEQLAAFVDGELSPPEAEAFQAHLTGCEACQAGLMDQVQASVAVHAAGETSRKGTRTPFQPAWARRRTRVLAFATGAVAVLLLGVLAVRTAGAPPKDPLLLAQAETRPLEGWLSYPGAERYRPLATMRSGSASAAALDHRILAELEDRGDFHGVATAYLRAGEFERAEQFLDRVPRSPEVDSDRALAALGRGEHERALVLLEHALASAPESLRAHWNRGVVLRAMSLELAASVEFQRVADKAEPGWSEEAKQLAGGLRTTAEARQKSWQALTEAGQALAFQGTPLPAAMVHRNPGRVRLYLYHALRTATSQEQVLALLPLAQSLDQVSRTRTASSAVQHVAQANFTRRAPLAETYRALLPDPGALPPPEAEAYLERLRRSGEHDLLLGAILLLGAERQHLAEVERLVQGTQDVLWYRGPLVKAQASEEMARGAGLAAEQRLREAVEEYRRAGLDYRSIALQEELSTLYNKLDRRREAMEVARAALEAARRTDDWFHEDLLVFDLVTSARLSHESALARAYLDEYLQRSPEDCTRRAEYHYFRALLAVEALDATGARREVSQAQACPAAPTLFEIAVYGDLLRFGATEAERARAEDRIRLLRQDSSLEPDQRLLLEHLAGRILIERDRPSGQRILREVIAGAEKLRATHIEARKAWSHSYQALVRDAGKAGEFDAAIALLSAELERDAPPACLLAVAGQDERVLFMARGPRGDSRGAYLEGLTRSLHETVPPVPAALLAVLEGCDTVQVLAEPLLQGRPGLLGPDRAWSYLAPKVRGPHAPAAGTSFKHVVVSDVEPPAALGLPRLLPWSRPPELGEVHLRGPSATPEAVLAELTDATQVEFHAHGLSRLGFSDASFLALSPGADGRYALTAADLQGRSLRGAPLVLLAACEANVGALRYHDVWSLPAAFIQAGASSVVAPSSLVPDAEVGAFFQELLERVDRGATAARALRDTRVAWLQKKPTRWVEDLVVFE